MPNRRQKTRVLGSYPAKLIVRGAEWPVTTRDISLKGAMLFCEPVPPLGEVCALHIPLSEHIVLVIEGTIIRSGAQEAAMQFSEMTPETYQHLLTLVRLKAENADQIENEIF